MLLVKILLHPLKTTLVILAVLFLVCLVTGHLDLFIIPIVKWLMILTFAVSAAILVGLETAARMPPEL